MKEVCKIINDIAPRLMDSLFQFCCNTHKIRNVQRTFYRKRKSDKYGTETVTYEAPPLWANQHTKYKNAKFVDAFKSKIKVWKCDFCQYRPCKKYVQNL